jgi:DNA-binding IclR family transcriptional regulator
MPTDAQGTRRALGLLKVVAAHHAQGVRLTDLMALTGQDKSTLHRQLRALMDEGFVERIPSTKRYRLGMESIQLGFFAPDMSPLVERFRPVLHRIARLCEDTVFLAVPSGDEVVYVARQEGAYPVKVFVAEPGKRRPLAFSAVGICLLARESDASIAALYARHGGNYLQQGLTLAVLREHVHFARRHGYSEVRDLGPAGTAGVGYGFAMSATASAGVSIAAIRSRMGVRRMRELGRLLQTELAPYVATPTA